jgi:DNA-directed RNA polymerase subunit M
MVEFCPECSSLMRKKNVDGKFNWVCKCGYIKPLEKDNRKIEKEIQRKSKALEKNLVIRSESISVYPKTSKFCPKCGHKEAETWQRQIRGADEPMTHFFRCVKCKYTWREQ